MGLSDAVAAAEAERQEKADADLRARREAAQNEFRMQLAAAGLITDDEEWSFVKPWPLQFEAEGYRFVPARDGTMRTYGRTVDDGIQRTGSIGIVLHCPTCDQDLVVDLSIKNHVVQDRWKADGDGPNRNRCNYRLSTQDERLAELAEEIARNTNPHGWQRPCPAEATDRLAEQIANTFGGSVYRNKVTLDTRDGRKLIVTVSGTR